MESYGTNMDESRYLVKDAELLGKTSSYPITDASIVLSPTETVQDFTTGGQRKRRYALVLSMAGLPTFEKMEDPIVLQSNLPKVLIDGDDIEILRARAHAELDAMFNVFEDTASGSLSMEGMEPIVDEESTE